MHTEKSIEKQAFIYVRSPILSEHTCLSLGPGSLFDVASPSQFIVFFFIVLKLVVRILIDSGVSLLLLVPAPLVNLAFGEASDLSHPHNPIFVPAALILFELLFEDFELVVALPLALPEVVFGVGHGVLLGNEELLLFSLVGLLHLGVLFLVLHGPVCAGQWAPLLNVGAQQLVEQVLLGLSEIGGHELQLPAGLGSRRELRVGEAVLLRLGQEEALELRVAV
jgi:hypothetical protein